MVADRQNPQRNAANDTTNAARRPKQKAESTPDTTLAKLLYQHGKADVEQLRRALAKQKSTGAFLGEILVEERILDEQSLLNFLAKHCKIPHLSLLDYLIDAKHLGLVSKELCQRCRLIPIDRLGNNLTVAMVNPLDEEAMKAVQAECPELQIKPVLCAYRHFEQVAAKFFTASPQQSPSTLSLQELGMPTAKPAPPTAATKNVAEQSAAGDDAPPEPEAPPEPDEDIPNAGKQEAERDALIQSVFEHDLSAVAAPKRHEPESAAHDGGEGAEVALDAALEATAKAMLGSMRETYEVLARRIPLFKGLKAAEVAGLFAKDMIAEVEEDVVLFNKGDAADGLYVILDGAIMIFDGRQILAELGRGDTVGEMAMINEGVRSAGARATMRTSVLKITRSTLMRRLAPEVANRLLLNLAIILSERLRTANTQLLMMLRNMGGGGK